MKITPELNRQLQVAAGNRYDKIACVLDLVVSKPKPKSKPRPLEALTDED
jgi:hypothetical protein